MKVVMIKDVPKVGQRGQLKEIADGYALNFLIPRGMAVQATPEKVAMVETQIKAEAQTKQASESQWASDAKKLDGITVAVSSAANENGHLYKQLSLEVIAEAVKKETGIILQTKSIILKNPIKSTGESTIEVHLGNNKAHLTVSVVGTKK